MSQIPRRGSFDEGNPPPPGDDDHPVDRQIRYDPDRHVQEIIRRPRNPVPLPPRDDMEIENPGDAMEIDSEISGRGNVNQPGEGSGHGNMPSSPPTKKIKLSQEQRDLLIRYNRMIHSGVSPISARAHLQREFQRLGLIKPRGGREDNPGNPIQRPAIIDGEVERVPAPIGDPAPAIVSKHPTKQGVSIMTVNGKDYNFNPDLLNQLISRDPVSKTSERLYPQGAKFYNHRKFSRKSNAIAFRKLSDLNGRF